MPAYTQIDDFSDPSTWTVVAGSGTVEVANGIGHFDTASNNVGNGIYRQIDTLDADKWTVAIKYNQHQQAGNGGSIVPIAIHNAELSSLSGCSGSWQPMTIANGVDVYLHAGNRTLNLETKVSGSNTSQALSGSSIPFSLDTDYWIVITRDGDTFTINLYDIDDLGGTSIGTASVTTSGVSTSLSWFSMVTACDNPSSYNWKADFDDLTIYDGVTEIPEPAIGVGIDAQIDDVVIFDEAIGVFAVETLYDSGNHRAPTELQNPSFASHWALNGVGTDVQKLASGIVNAQPPANPNTSTDPILKNIDVGQPNPLSSPPYGWTLDVIGDVQICLLYTSDAADE